jgi:hypothetical protein
MMTSFGFIAAYAVLIAIASVIEVPMARGFASVQLNLLIRVVRRKFILGGSDLGLIA